MQTIRTGFFAAILLVTSVSYADYFSYRWDVREKGFKEVKTLLDGAQLGPCKLRIEHGAGMTVWLDQKADTHYFIFLNDDFTTWRANGDTFTMTHDHPGAGYRKATRLTIQKDFFGQVKRVRLQEWKLELGLLWVPLFDAVCKG